MQFDIILLSLKRNEGINNKKEKKEWMKEKKEKAQKKETRRNKNERLSLPLHPIQQSSFYLLQ